MNVVQERRRMTMDATGRALAVSLKGMHLVLRDEGLCRLSRVAPEEDFRVLWSVDVPAGRDLSLDGEGRILLGTGLGYELRDPETGRLLSSSSAWPGTQTAVMLGNEILLTCIGQTEDGSGPAIILRRLAQDGSERSSSSLPGYGYVRLARPGRDGVALAMTSNTRVLTVDAQGSLLSDFPILTQLAQPHSWKVESWNADPNMSGYLVATGYQAELQIFDAEGRHLRTVQGPAATRPFFYSDFRTLPDGRLLVVNWQDHGPGHGNDGDQILLFDPNEDWRLLDSWRPGPGPAFSSIQGALPIPAR
jgi:hypothetical protein